MRLRREVVVSYDIENDKSRKKLHDKLKDVGLLPIQLSVFWGFVTNAEMKALKRLLNHYTDEKDRSFIIKTNLTKEPSDNFYGYSNFSFKEPENYDVL